MTSYMAKRFTDRGDSYSVACLLANAYNHATSPSAMRTDREHQLQRIRAKLLRGRLRSLRGLVEESESGRMVVVVSR